MSADGQRRVSAEFTARFRLQSSRMPDGHFLTLLSATLSVFRRPSTRTSDMDKIIAFDQSHLLDDFMALPGANRAGLSGENRVTILRRAFLNKSVLISIT